MKGRRRVGERKLLELTPDQKAYFFGWHAGTIAKLDNQMIRNRFGDKMEKATVSQRWL